MPLNFVSMKTITQNYKTGKLEIADVPAPAVQPGGILVQTNLAETVYDPAQRAVSVKGFIVRRSGVKRFRCNLSIAEPAEIAAIDKADRCLPAPRSSP